MLLEETLLFFNMLKLEFKYSSASLYVVLKGYLAHIENSKANYLKKCAEYIGIGYDFPKAFQKAVEDERLFTADEKYKLILFGNSLGTSSVDTQLELIGYYTEVFQKRYKESCDASEKNSKAAMLICTFTGLGIYIISV